jgi:transposase-like protein
MVGKSNFSPQEKAEVVLLAFKSPDNISEICRKHNIAPITFARWKKNYLEGGLNALKPSAKSNSDIYEKETQKLKLIIGDLYVELEYLKKKLGMLR